MTNKLSKSKAKTMALAPLEVDRIDSIYNRIANHIDLART